MNLTFSEKLRGSTSLFPDLIASERKNEKKRDERLPSRLRPRRRTSASVEDVGVGGGRRWVAAHRDIARGRFRPFFFFFFFNWKAEADRTQTRLNSPPPAPIVNVLRTGPSIGPLLAPGRCHTSKNHTPLSLAIYRRQIIPIIG